MSVKKKRYPARVGWIGWNDGNRFHWKKREDGHQVRVRVTDARALTAEKVAEKLCQREFDNLQGVGDTDERSGFAELYVEEMAQCVGMTATIDDNGNVKVRRVKA